ncbi:hypothetical protein ANN_14621 [Periplaneta americana]|uniref:Per a allergen n=1 Tax=Periplaneta americana TaxID=6978 RepID=A0ABQ8SWR8_PERAM|nr:hypothetical protein ANN_14621 [Periplaneta americana]
MAGLCEGGNEPPGFLNAINSDKQWIGRDGTIGWAARSPDLALLDFYVWGHLKSLVYETPIETEDELGCLQLLTLYSTICLEF